MKTNAQLTLTDRHRPQQLPRTVLVVEDDYTVREMLDMVLRDRGYSVLSAGGGAEALELIKAWRGAPIDLLITDVEMPPMNSAALASEPDELMPAQKVIFMSGYSVSEPFAMKVDLRNAFYLRKPAAAHSAEKAIRILFAKEFAFN